MSQSDGANYDFFAGLLPPLRYVDAEFRSAPDRSTKARYVSNGSGVNLLATTPWWRVDGLVPVAFLAGSPPEPFGASIDRLRGPTLEGGWRTLVQTEYRFPQGTLQQEAFASVEPPFDPADASVFVHFRYLAIAAIEPDTGLLPRSAYCGDIATPVHGLVPNSILWRGLRDLAAALEDVGDTAAATTLREAAGPLRQATLAAVERSQSRDRDPPFVPMALFGAEPPCETLTATRLGSYWNLIASYALDPGVFGQANEHAPAGWQPDSARVGAEVLPVDTTGAVDLCSRSGRVLVELSVRRQRP